MRSAVVATAALLLLSKLLDCASTQLRLRSPAQETNPWARRAMERLGVAPVIWGVGLVAAAIVLGSAAPALLPGQGWYAAGFVLLGVPIALVQLDVAASNATGRPWPLSRLVMRVHGAAGSWRGRR